MVRQSTFLVDSTVLIAHIRKKAPTVFHKARHAYGTPVVSEVVIFELEVGARRAGQEFEFQSHFAHLQTYPLPRKF
ncbi:MAG: hypothetical protein K8I82_22890 [Anaerolineae bacterium]|nr:hypothetical protein [Anaerolineae bacterium]